MKKKVVMFPILAGLFLISCSVDTSGWNDAEIVQEKQQNMEDVLPGRWVEPNPIDATDVQGIELLKGGDAKSINMATLVYSKWWTTDNQLFLEAKSIGNRTSSIDTFVYEIITVNDDSLILKDADIRFSYRRQ